MKRTEIQEMQENATRRKGVIVKALRAIAEQKNDVLTPYDVLAEARNPESVLHESFEWDDTSAGEKYRLMQARVILNTVKVEYNGEKREAFYNTTVTIGGETMRGYFTLERMLTDEEVRKQVLLDAIHDLESAQEKYKSLQELRGVINTKKLERVKSSL